MKFKYKKYADAVIRPIIPVIFRHGTEEFRCEALVDSGADLCLANAEIADILGLDLKAGSPGAITGVTGSPEPCWSFPITVVVGGHEKVINMSFAEKAGHWGYQILGQEGFFEAFNIKFTYLKSEIEIVPAKL